ncbi:stage II sporulation protein M [Paenibacillus sp. YPG26]|uniref:stage II sporulation protein M n=1 Tax=Paenibacillus sp. YPG26 TaxID=2878915 RepID=UPI0020413F98|nr:stage II sporulation protein M [Paenibacillus sp. YPG26]USB32715.1 stage II sporulation protein M [Paenibacillus sp. YPG26]
MLSLRSFGAHLKRSQAYLWTAVLLFAVGFGLGMVNADFLQRIVVDQLRGLQEVSSKLAQSDNPELSFFTFIFFNNAIKGVLIIYLGILVGVIPVFFLIVNGMVLGYLIEVQSSLGNSISDLVFRGLLPHGIIEIPAIIIASAFGIKFGVASLRGIGRLFSGKEERGAREWGAMAKSSLNVSLWIVILLFIAAIIESTLTFHLMKG